MSTFDYDPAGMDTIPLQEIPDLKGQDFTGPWLTIDELDCLSFERATLLDKVYPDPPPPEFGEGVIEGFFTLALLDALWNQVLRFDRDRTYTVNYGVDRVRFVAPLLVGQRLRLKLAVVDVTPRGRGHLVHMHCVISTEGSERPGMVADWLILVRPRRGSH